MSKLDDVQKDIAEFARTKAPALTKTPEIVTQVRNIVNEVVWSKLSADTVTDGTFDLTQGQATQIRNKLLTSSLFGGLVPHVEDIMKCHSEEELTNLAVKEGRDPNKSFTSNRRPGDYANSPD